MATSSSPRTVIGIAIGAGTNVAVETANVVLMRSDPLDIAAARRLSRATVREMKQNLGRALRLQRDGDPIATGVLCPPPASSCGAPMV